MTHPWNPSSPLSSREVVALEFMRRCDGENRQPTLSEVAKAIGRPVYEKVAAVRVLRQLRDRGLVKK